MRIFLAVAAVLAWLFGAMLLFAPGPFYAPTGMALTPMLATVAQAHGATLVGLGVVDWLARGADRRGLRAVLAGNLVVQALSLGVVIRTMALGAGAAVAPGVLIHVVLGGLFAYFLVRRAETFRDRASRVLASSRTRAEKAKALAELVRSERACHWVGLYDVSETQVSAIAWSGREPPAFPTFPVSRGLNGAAVAERRPVVVQDVSKDGRYLTTFGATRAEAIFPVLGPDSTRVVGTIDVESDRVNAFRAEDEAFLRECAALLLPLWR